MTVLLDLTDKILPEGRVKVPRRAAAPRAPVTVNGVAIGEDAIRAEAQNHPSDTPGGALMAAARALAVRELLVQEARASGIAAEAETLGAGLRETDEDALIRALLAGAISTPTAGEAECRRYYRNNPGKFRSETIYEARHILFAARPEEADARRDARAGAERAIAVLAAHPERFAELALMHSACPSRHQGGSLGQLTRGSTVPEFEAMLSTLADGQLSRRRPRHASAVTSSVSTGRSPARRCLSSRSLDASPPGSGRRAGAAPRRSISASSPDARGSRASTSQGRTGRWCGRERAGRDAAR